MEANTIVEEQLNELAVKLEDCFSADVLGYIGSLLVGADELIRDGIEAIHPKRDRLLFLLETNGGFIETVERIVGTLRHYYKEVDFIVPNYAMSAGTVLVMSGDAIYMDYFSVLGPIDPQIPRRGASQLPALGYLIQYQRLMDKAKDGMLNTAEMAVLLKFDQAELYLIEQARELSIALLKDWLVKYKFKNWVRTETQGKPVTLQMKRNRAAAIGRMLNNPSIWHAHGRAIPMTVLQKDMNLKIEDFGENENAAKMVRSYHHLLLDYMRKTGHNGFLHVKGHHVPVDW